MMCSCFDYIYLPEPMMHFELWTSNRLLYNITTRVCIHVIYGRTHEILYLPFRLRQNVSLDFIERNGMK